MNLPKTFTQPPCAEIMQYVEAAKFKYHKHEDKSGNIWLVADGRKFIRSCRLGR